MEPFVEARETLPFVCLLYYFHVSSVLLCLVVFYILILLGSSAYRREGVGDNYCDELAESSAEKVSL